MATAGALFTARSWSQVTGSNNDIRDQLSACSKLAEPYARFTKHLAANDVDLEKTPAAFGAPLIFDADSEKFTSENSTAAKNIALLGSCLNWCKAGHTEREAVNE